jgi:hypothetical protein
VSCCDGVCYIFINQLHSAEGSKIYCVRVTTPLKVQNKEGTYVDAYLCKVGCTFTSLQKGSQEKQREDVVLALIQECVGGAELLFSLRPAVYDTTNLFELEKQGIKRGGRGRG